MKKYFNLCFFTFFLVAAAFSQNNPGQNAVKLVENFNYSKYLDSPIHSLIVIAPINSYSEYSYITNQPSVLSGLKLKFSDEVFLEVYVGTLAYQKNYNSQANWNFDLLLGEKISKVRVMVNGQVYKEKGKVL
jgi:hypothetical protein